MNNDPKKRLEVLNNESFKAALKNIQDFYATYKQYETIDNNDNDSDSDDASTSSQATNDSDLSEIDNKIEKAFSLLQDKIHGSNIISDANTTKLEFNDIKRSIDILSKHIHTLSKQNQFKEEDLNTIFPALQEINNKAAKYENDEIHKIINSISKNPNLYAKILLNPNFIDPHKNTHIKQFFESHSLKDIANLTETFTIKHPTKTTENPSFVGLKNILKSHLNEKSHDAYVFTGDYGSIYKKLTEFKSKNTKFFNDTFQPLLQESMHSDHVLKTSEQKHHSLLFHGYTKPSHNINTWIKKFDYTHGYTYKGLALIASTKNQPAKIEHHLLAQATSDLKEALLQEDISKGVELLDALKGHRLEEADPQKNGVLNTLIEATENVLLQSLTTKRNSSMPETPKQRNALLAELELTHVIDNIEKGHISLEETINTAKKELLEYQQQAESLATNVNLSTQKQPASSFVEMDITKINDIKQMPSKTTASKKDEPQKQDNEIIRQAYRKEIDLLQAKLALLEEMQSRQNEQTSNKTKSPHKPT